MVLTVDRPGGVRRGVLRADIDRIRRFHSRHDEWKVNLGADGYIEIIGEDVQAYNGDDFNDLGVRETRRAQRLELTRTDLASLEDNGLGESEHGSDLRVRPRGLSGPADFLLAHAKVSTLGTVHREAVTAPVDFSYGQGDLFALLRREPPLAECLLK